MSSVCATILLRAVIAPWPISVLEAKTRTVPSASLRSRTLGLIRSRSPAPVNPQPWKNTDSPTPRRQPFTSFVCARFSP